MVPTSVILRMLVTEPDLSEEYIANVLRQFGYRATITVEEDGILAARGFAQKMPDEFWDRDSSLYRNPCARYIAAGLYDDLVQREKDTWL
jgi:hypothetical protein